MKKGVLNVNPSFKVDTMNRVVVCILECEFPILNNIDYYVWKKVTRKFPRLHRLNHFKISAKAICAVEDEFDELKGKKIAEAKARRKLYDLGERLYHDIAKEVFKYADMFRDQEFDFLNKCRKETYYLKNIGK